MTFEVYPCDHGHAPSRRQRALGVTLNIYGQLLVNAATFAALGQPSHVRLLYDHAAGTIGIQASRDSERHALRVFSPRAEPRRRRVSAKGFCTYFTLQSYRGRWYRGEMRGGMLCVSLDDQRGIASTEVEPIDCLAAPLEYSPLVGALSLPLPQMGAGSQGRKAPHRGRHRRRHGLAER